MGQLPGPPPDFAGLFANPSTQRMLDELTDHEFEHFVKYVFEQAGYFVEDAAGQYGQGLDLRLYTGPAHARVLCAGVSVKHFSPPDVVVHGPHVMGLRGALAPLGGIPGYVVTTSSFNKPARDAANQAPRIWPIDGDHFVRYINCVRGSRAVEAEDTEPDVRLHTHSLDPIPAEVLLAADDIERRPKQQTRVLTLANQKGGVGKTTSALNIAFGLMAKDHQVLLVDMDPQANLTKVLSAGKMPQIHLGEYFARRRTLAELIHPTQFPQVWLIPSNNELALVDKGVTSGPGAMLRFMRDLHAPDIQPPQVLDDRPFDWIIVDTGPAMGFFTRTALAASHYVIMPIAPGAFSQEGLNFLRNAVTSITALTGKTLELLGCVITQWREDATNRQLVAPIEASLGTLGPRIPVDKNIDKAHLETGSGQKKMLFSHKTSAAAKAYTAVVEEVLHSVNA